MFYIVYRLTLDYRKNLWNILNFIPTRYYEMKRCQVTSKQGNKRTTILVPQKP